LNDGSAIVPKALPLVLLLLRLQCDRTMRGKPFNLLFGLLAMKQRLNSLSLGDEVNQIKCTHGSLTAKVSGSR
jgi:hypothetical protein